MNFMAEQPPNLRSLNCSENCQIWCLFLAKEVGFQKPTLMVYLALTPNTAAGSSSRGEQVSGAAACFVSVFGSRTYMWCIYATLKVRASLSETVLFQNVSLLRCSLTVPIALDLPMRLPQILKCPNPVIQPTFFPFVPREVSRLPYIGAPSRF